jgi:hypothetical protein
MLNYWHRLETLDSTFLILQDAYITSKTLFESKTTSWYGSIHTILEQISQLWQDTNICRFFMNSQNKFSELYIVWCVVTSRCLDQGQSPSLKNLLHVKMSESRTEPSFPQESSSFKTVYTIISMSCVESKRV